MKILHITASMDPKLGGVCQALKTMISGLVAFYPEIQNEVVSFDEPNASFITEKTYRVNALGAGKSPWFYNDQYVPWLQKNLSGFDIVILHGLWNYQGFGLIKAFNKLKSRRADNNNYTIFNTKLFVMPHGMLDPYFQKAAGRKLKAARNWFYWKLIERKVVAQAAGLLFTCEAEMQLARKTFTPYHPVKELVVGLGVEEPPAYTEDMKAAFSNTCLGLNSQSYLLFISRIHVKKGVDILMNSYADMVDSKAFNRQPQDFSFVENDTKNIKLVIAGPGSETIYGEKIKASAALLNQHENAVFFPGMLSGDAKWGAFYNSEAFVLPSHQENFGIAVVEALACGKPVLISNQVNIWTEIAASKAGIIADDTATGTQELLNSWNKLSKEQKKEMGLNARKCFENNFAVKTATINLLKAINA